MNDEPTFGQWLVSHRRASGLSQRQFAEMTGLEGYAIVNELEHDRIDPRPFVESLAGTLNVDIGLIRRLASAHEDSEMLSQKKQQTVEAKMLAFRLERGSR